MGSTGNKSSAGTSTYRPPLGTTPTAAPVTPTATVGGGIPITPVNAGNPGVGTSAPSATNTPVVPGAVDALSKLTDAEMAQLIRASKSAQLPNFLNDKADATQRFVFQAGVNEKPMVLDQAGFNKFMSDNGISRSEILSRSVGGANYRNQDNTNIRLTPQQVHSLFTDSRFNYIGGKHGGQAYGAGAYFDMNGGRATGYGGAGSATLQAVLNPKTARPIQETRLYSKTNTWLASHPQVRRELGSINSSNQSIYALLQGYNVITEYSPTTKSGYHTVIDRSALVCLK